MRVKRAAAQALMDALVSKMNVALAQPPTVINAPPSQKTQYPAMAIMIDSAEMILSNDDEDVQYDPTKTQGDIGYELTGSFRTDAVTNDYVVGPTYMLDQDTTLSQIGTVRMKGRIWVAARLDAKREQIEQEVSMAFYSDRAAPGRIMVPIIGVEINDVKIPFGFATAILEDKLQWNSEFAFNERLWTFAPVSIDAPLMIPRRDPLAQQLILIVSEDLETTVSVPSDVDNLADAQQFSVASDGAVTQL